MKKIYNLLLLLILQVSFSQTGIIKGTIIDEISGKSISGAKVKLVELNKTVISDGNGVFIFTDLTVDRFSLKITCNSYESKIVSEVDTALNETTSLAVSLLKSDKVLNEVVIKSTKMKTESIKSLLLQQKIV